MQKINNKIKDWFNISTFEITLAGLFLGITIIVGQFIRLDLGVMRIGFTFPLYILMGLLLKPITGIIVTLLSDNILLALSPVGFGNWIWAYAIIPLFIYFISYFFKKLIKHKNEITWWVLMILIMFSISISMIILFSINNNFIYDSKDPNSILNMTNTTTKILVWTGVSFIIVSQLLLMLWYYFNKSTNLKLIISIYSLVALVIVSTIWIWGPIAQILWLNRFSGSNKSYWELYNVYLISRIIKTPIIMPIYVVIIIPIYKALASLSQINNHNTW